MSGWREGFGRSGCRVVPRPTSQRLVRLPSPATRTDLTCRFSPGTSRPRMPWVETRSGPAPVSAVITPSRQASGHPAMRGQEGRWKDMGCKNRAPSPFPSAKRPIRRLRATADPVTRNSQSPRQATRKRESAGPSPGPLASVELVWRGVRLGRESRAQRRGSALRACPIRELGERDVVAQEVTRRIGVGAEGEVSSFAVVVQPEGRDPNNVLHAPGLVEQWTP